MDAEARPSVAAQRVSPTGAGRVVGAPEPLRDETDHERLDRNLVELLQEVRVVQTGVQVLFAFLLTVPFSSRFDAITGFQRGAYFAALVGSAAASVLLIAPTAVHRACSAWARRSTWSRSRTASRSAGWARPPSP